MNPAPVPPSPQAADLVPADWHPQLEAALRNHDAELRRFVVATLDSFADRITSDVRKWIGEAPALQDPPAAPPQAWPQWWIAGVLAALLIGAVFGGLYLRTLAQMARWLQKIRGCNRPFTARRRYPADQRSSGSAGKIRWASSRARVTPGGASVQQRLASRAGSLR